MYMHVRELSFPQVHGVGGEEHASRGRALSDGALRCAMHRFRLSTELCRQLESRFRAWPVGRGEVRGIVEANDAIVARGGFFAADEWQAIPVPVVEAVQCPETLEAPALRFEVTEICCANIDTVSAALMLGDACALNFANADTPGGRYRSGGLAQEEDLCRLLPQLYPALASCSYPIPPGTSLVAQNLLAVRQPGTYATCASLGLVTILSAAMPCGARRPKSGWAGSEWADTVTLRIRSVLHAAKHTGHANVVLGAFGCGAFGNPAGHVAAIFREQLMSPEFRGAFATVVFAIIDPELFSGTLFLFQPFFG